MSQPKKSKRILRMSLAGICILLVGAILWLRQAEGGLKNVFSLTYWQNHFGGFEMYRPSVGYFTRGNADHKDICFTFDDGPHVKGAPLIMDVLKREGIHATFFV